jgi:prepilin-type N-terminal cleavage/methylation domain-containing protein
MQVKRTRGLSLVEILIALTILGIGVMGLIGVGVAVNRMLGSGRWATEAAAIAERRLETLRAAAVDSAACASLSGGSAPASAGLTETWIVRARPSSVAVDVIVASASSGPDTISTLLSCP